MNNNFDTYSYENHDALVNFFHGDVPWALLELIYNAKEISE